MHPLSQHSSNMLQNFRFKKIFYPQSSYENWEICIFHIRLGTPPATIIIVRFTRKLLTQMSIKMQHFIMPRCMLCRNNKGVDTFPERLTSLQQCKWTLHISELKRLQTCNIQQQQFAIVYATSYYRTLLQTSALLLATEPRLHGAKW